MDRHEFLSWLIDLVEKMKQNEDTVFKLLMAQILLVGTTQIFPVHVHLCALFG